MKTMATVKTVAGILTFYWRFKMSEQIENKVTVAEMLRTTGANTAEFMAQVAAHIDKLEESIVQLTNRITELEASNK